MNKSNSSPVEQAFRSALTDNFKGNDDPSFILGVSGGADSMCLMYLFHKMGLRAKIVHINYGKRGDASEKDAKLVMQKADEWGFEASAVEANEIESQPNNFQAWARDFRYQVFRSAAAEYKATGIALAHHRDDQIETIVQKIFRGAGLESWSAMQVWEGELFRPLLPVSKQQVLRYCKKLEVPYRTDQSNLKPDFARNFLRNEWLNKLHEHFPGWKENIERIPQQAEIFSDALRYISGHITDDKGRISRKELMELDQSLAQALILHKIRKADPSVSVSRSALEELGRLKNLQTGKSIQLNPRYSILRDRDWFKIVYEESEPLTLTKLQEKELSEKPLRLDNLQIALENFSDADYEQNLYLDAEKISWPLSLRNWKNGDSFQPYGMGGHQNVSDHLTNRKISAAQKGSALVLEGFDGTICAVIFPPSEMSAEQPPGTISEQLKCDGRTLKCLKIKYV